MSDSGDPVFEPTIYGNSSAEEKQAAEQYVQTYGGSIDYAGGDAPTGDDIPSKGTPPPSLAMTFAASDITFDASVGADPDTVPGSAPPTTPPALQPPFKISLANLRETTTTVMNSTSALLTMYTALKSQTMAAVTDDAFWGQNVGRYVPNLPDTVSGPDGPADKK